jgi:peptidoglycan/LPS O-acetylase OafA/YrhL
MSNHHRSGGSPAYKSDAFWHFHAAMLSQLVDIFFWVSGFVNYVSLEHKFATSKQKGAQFFLSLFNRVLRLYPVCWIVIIYWWKVHQSYGQQNFNNFNGSIADSWSKTGQQACPEGSNS